MPGYSVVGIASTIAIKIVENRHLYRGGARACTVRVIRAEPPWVAGLIEIDSNVFVGYGIRDESARFRDCSGICTASGVDDVPCVCGGRAYLFSGGVGILIHRTCVTASAHPLIPGVDAGDFIRDECGISPPHTPENGFGRDRKS